MSAKNFKFVSPGVFVKEIDNSQLTKTAPPVGPVVIGRFRRGPAFLPTRIESLSELIQIFGEQIRGDESNDVWRGGIPTAPTYGAYAAAAWLKNGSPVTVVRVLGDQHPEVGSATDNSAAGWLMGSTPSNQDNPGGAYGLFLQNPFPSASFGATGSVEGVLAATWYFNSGGIILSGTLAPGAETSAYAPTVSGSMTLIKSSTATSPSQTFTAQLFTSGSDNAGTPSDVLTFNFDRNSKYYIRKVFNTNPTLVNSSLVDSAAVKNYFLGETFEKSVASKITGTQCYGFIAPLATSTQGGHVFKAATRPGQTGWFMAQDMRTTAASSDVTENQLTPAFDADSAAICPRLFKFHTLSTGESEQKQFKISIENIKYSNRVDIDPYGTFSLVVRSASDRDNVVQVIEQFTDLNLNPASPNYIARVIGDTYEEYDYTYQRVNRYGQYENNSKFVRIEMNPDVENGLDDRLLPFGVTGPLAYKSALLTSGSTLNTSSPEAILTLSSSNVPGDVDGAPAGGWATPIAGMNLKLEYPKTAIRTTASAGNLADQRDASFGLQTTIAPESSRYDTGFSDYLWRMSTDLTSEDSVQGIYSDTKVEYSWQVSLDDIVVTGTRPDVYWESGSHAAGTSYTAISGTTALLDLGYNSITAPLYGGHDGFDITEAEPLRNGLLTGKSVTNSAPYNTIKRAIDSVRDPEFVECNIMTVPGLTDETLTNHLLDVCEDRGDALAIIDLPNVYTPFTDSISNFKDRIQRDPSSAVTDLRNRGLNNSYGCTYYPWVQINDTISNRLLWAPPSVIALGTMANSEAETDVWFAPAGFNRGGLSDGSAGWPVLNVTKRLTSKDRDTLYEANINPIASFPSEGIVVFGQKTLQVTRSALDRINVRRLLILIKKQVSRIAAGVLFDQNTQVTWNRFLGEVEPFLAGVKSGLGLSEYKVILDDTTTTPDLVDQNIMYAKIFLKPARAIEFIAVDFVITNSGASFDD